MRSSLARRIVLVLSSMALLGGPSIVPAGAATPSAAEWVQPMQVNTVPPDVFGASLTAEGEVVRTTPTVTVERVTVGPELRARHPAVPATVYRVTVAGRFPPRADRYVVLAGGRPVGYGMPARGQRALRTITTDEAVTTATITTAYGAPRSRPRVAGGLSPTLEAVAADIGNPASRGPLEVSRAVYDLGPKAFQPQGLGAKVELVGDVHHPTDLSAGPFPLVLFMHGNHSTCYRGQRASYEWPCREGWKPLPNYAGYDYIARKLASWGYVVVSVSANGVNYFGNWVDDTGMRQRGDLLEKHIDLWQTWSTTGGDPFGSTFVGAVNLSKIGTMGHSRGGEGAVWNTIVDRERPTPYGIDAVLALAPVDFTRVTINDVAFNVTLPYCDGDVSDLQGIHFFDDSRYLVANDQTPKSTVTVFGANHNFFNTVWSPSGGYPGAFDDGEWTSCSDPLTEPQERHVGAAYIVGFFRRYLGGELSLDGMWTGADVPRVPARTLVSYLAPASRRLDVARFDDAGDLGTGELGAIEPTSMSWYGWCSDEWRTPCVPSQMWIDVHLSFSWFTEEQLPGLGQATLGWTRTDAAIRFAIPSSRSNVASYDAFQFRAATNPSYQANEGWMYQDLVVALIDGSGRRSEVVASEVGNEALAYPLGRRGAGHYILNQLRFPIEAFDGVDLTNIRFAEIAFSRTPSGVVNVSDVAFSRGAV